MKKGNANQKGVIALEALLALVLFVMVGTALLNVNGQAAHQRQQLLHTRCANWLAENLITEALLSPSARMKGQQKGDAQQCDLDWHWVMQSSALNDNRFYLITLEIYDSANQLQLERQTLRAR